eukprot:12479361-Heterocapsa_arctica.AAC.1
MRTRQINKLEPKEKMKRQGKAGEHEKGNNNNTREKINKDKMRNKNKEVNKKPAKTQDYNE